MILLPLLLWACSPGDDSGTSDSDGDGGSSDGGSSDSGSSDGGSSDSGSSDSGSTTLALVCPEGMSAVPPDAPEYCIDTWEASVSDGGPVSVPGVIPTVGITYADAVAACAGSPVLGADGTVLSDRWLATLDQWRDAADNQRGDGGDTYPWGDDWVDGRCASPLEDGTIVLDGLVETGSYPDCVSEAGVYDQVGNAFEWADPGLYLDTDAFLEARAAEGRPMSIDGDGRILLLSGELGDLRVDIAGVSGTVQQDADGVLWVSGSAAGAGDGFWGYVYTGTGTELDDAARLPVGFSDAGDGVVSLRHHVDVEGQPVPAKMGCPYYVGDAGTCALDHVALNHTYDFDGTIGFRCASDPVDPAAL